MTSLLGAAAGTDGDAAADRDVSPPSDTSGAAAWLSRLDLAAAAYGLTPFSAVAAAAGAGAEVGAEARAAFAVSPARRAAASAAFAA